MSHRPLIFADSNVFVEALFIEDSQAAVVIRLVALQWYELATCAEVVNDVEKAISNKAKHSSTDEDDLLNRWRIIVKATNLKVFPDALPNKASVYSLHTSDAAQK